MCLCMHAHAHMQKHTITHPPTHPHIQHTHTQSLKHAQGRGTQPVTHRHKLIVGDPQRPKRLQFLGQPVGDVLDGVAREVEHLQARQVLDSLDAGDAVVGHVELSQAQQPVHLLHALDHVVTEVQHLQLAQPVQVFNVLSSKQKEMDDDERHWLQLAM